MSLKKYAVLVIDDDTDVLTAVRLLLKTEVREITTEKNPENIPALLRQNRYDLILLDMNFKSAVNTGNEGIFWLKKIKQLQPQVAVIMITAYGDIELAIRSLKEGATDFVVKPWHNARLLQTIQEAVQRTATSTPKDTAGIAGSELLGNSEAMQSIFYKISKVAPTDANILILGENGTGKDLIARAIHQASLRVKAPLVKVDVGALTESLFESELFGHKKGAFTDAREDREGRFESAHGGTLFLDEIGNISIRQQARLLTVLQNRTVTRIGSNQAIPVDIRLICATNVPLQELADESRFRKDLIYRINTVEITVPPLRKRKDDILLLAAHFAGQYAAKYLKPAMHFSQQAEQKLLQYHFPGNVRELQYMVERAIIMAEGQEIQATDLHFSPLETAPRAAEEPAELNLNSLEKNAILKVIEKHGGNISRAAKELGLTRTALYRRLNKYDI
jgi:two-component system response regulator HydG